MRRCRALVFLACVIAAGASASGQQPPKKASKPQVPIVSVVGCASHPSDGTWLLTNATDGAESDALFISAKELEDSKKVRLGSQRYKLVGTPEFLTKEELLKSGQRAQFTRPAVANATGQLRDGKRLLVKGLLTAVPSEKRINLTAVQQLADTCK